MLGMVVDGREAHRSWEFVGARSSARVSDPGYTNMVEVLGVGIQVALACCFLAVLRFESRNGSGSHARGQAPLKSSRRNRGPAAQRQLLISGSCTT